MKKIKMSDNKMKFTVDVGDCQVDIIIRRVREPKPTVHIEDIPIDYRRNPLNVIVNALIFLASMLVFSIFLMLIFTMI